MNNSYTTANVGELGSTTGNIYGVYDMNGGAWERVAAWDTLSTSGYITSYGSSFASKNGSSTKYATAYENGTGTNNGVMAKTVCKTGDAVRETYTNGDRGWFNDYSYFACAPTPFSYVVETTKVERQREYLHLTTRQASLMRTILSVRFWLFRFSTSIHKKV